MRAVASRVAALFGRARSADAATTRRRLPKPNEPRADSPATAEVEPRADAEPIAAPVEAAEPRVEAPAPAEAEPSTEAPPPGKAEPRAEDTFDWNATPGPAKYAAFMDAFPADKYGGPAYVPAYPPQKK